ncbi:hypothetical protein [Thermus albus]|uniref:hypothetical protein n=1 Tax=Thermus albus TaxID=2908146 RepID=UPI001FAB34CB|nr:hypothetical protein [Thermus albus]
MKVLLDASALLALLLEEPGAQRVGEAAAEGVAMSTGNLQRPSPSWQRRYLPRGLRKS